MAMNFLSIKYFLALAREGNFTRAAETLYITQQTLSAHIAALEKETGGPLFVRRVPVSLTGAGEVFYRYALAFEENEKALLRELSAAHGEMAGTLRIGVAPARGQLLLPAVIHRYRKMYPGVSIRLVEAANDSLVHALESRNLDLVLARFAGPVAGLVQIPFYKERLVLLGAKTLLEKRFGKKKEDIIRAACEGKEGWLAPFRSCPVLLNSQRDIIGSFVRGLYKNAGFEPCVAVESENMATLLGLCLSGEGIFFCVENLARKLLTEQEIKQLRVIHFAGAPSYDISFAVRKENVRPAMTGAFITMARDIHGTGEKKRPRPNESPVF